MVKRIAFFIYGTFSRAFVFETSLRGVSQTLAALRHRGLSSPVVMAPGQNPADEARRQPTLEGSQVDGRIPYRGSRPCSLFSTEMAGFIAP